MSFEISNKYESKCYNLFHLNRDPENRELLKKIIGRFVLYLKMNRLVVDDDEIVYSIDFKYPCLLHMKGEKKQSIIPLFINWYKTTLNDYDVIFQTNYEYITNNLLIYLKHCSANLPVIQVSNNYIQFLNGLYNTETQIFYNSTNQSLKKKRIFTTQKIEHNFNA
jgi:hypothetical protein